MAASDHISRRQVVNRPQVDRTYIPSEAGVEGETHYPLVAYHGTSREAADAIMREGFIPSYKGRNGPGIYTAASPDEARYYSMAHDNPAVIRVVLHPNNPVSTQAYRRNRQTEFGPTMDIIDARQSDVAGHDVWERRGMEYGTPLEYLALDPSSITPLDVSYPER